MFGIQHEIGNLTVLYIQILTHRELPIQIYELENLVINDSGHGLPRTRHIGSVLTNVHLLRIEHFEQILFSFHIILTGNVLC